MNPFVAVAGVGLLGAGVSQGRSARRASKKAAALEQAQARIVAYQERVRAARDVAINAAELNNAAAQGGVAGSSGALGGASSLVASYGASVGAARQVSLLGERAAYYNRKAGNKSARSGLYSSLGSTALSSSLALA